MPRTKNIMTGKAKGATRESFHAVGWTDEAMIAEGYLIQVVYPDADWDAPLSPGRQEFFPPPTPNTLGVTDLRVVSDLFHSFMPMQHYPGGYSFAQQLLLTAQELVKRAGLK